MIRSYTLDDVVVDATGDHADADDPTVLLLSLLYVPILDRIRIRVASL